MIRYLASHGYVYDRTKGSHHILINQSTHKRLAVPNRKELRKGITLDILNEAGIDRDDFVREFS